MENLREKSVNFWARTVLRIMAWVTLMFYMIFRIIIPVINAERVVLDKNDGYVMIGCISLLIAIEAVKLAVDAWLSRKSAK